MARGTIIKELNMPPLMEKLLVMEKTLKSIREDKEKNLSKAVKELYNDYKKDEELTIFNQLDKKPFCS